MNIHIGRDGQRTIRMTKHESRTLRNAAHILSNVVMFDTEEEKDMVRKACSTLHKHAVRHE